MGSIAIPATVNRIGGGVSISINQSFTTKAMAIAHGNQPKLYQHTGFKTIYELCLKKFTGIHRMN